MEEIEKGLEFKSEIISKHKREQEDNLTKLQNEMDVKIKELNEKLLLLEKHDRKYNLLFYASGPRRVLIKFSSFEDREIVFSKAYKLAGSRRRILTDQLVAMKRERGRLAKQAYKIRQDEKLQTRTKEMGLSVWFEVRKDRTENWVKRVISID